MGTKVRPTRAADAERQRLDRKDARRARRRDEIVQAAARIAAAAGPDAITADDVGAALAMSAPSVFYYFPGGLPELRAAVALQRFYGRMDQALAGVARARTGVGALVAWVRGLAQAYADDIEGLGTDLEVMMRGDWGRELVAAHIERLNAQFTIVEQKLQRDRDAGRLHGDVQDLRRMAMLMNQLALGLIVGDQWRQKVGGGSKHALQALVDDLCGLIERGVRAP